MAAAIPMLVDGGNDAAVSFLFAHGAGAPMDSEFMNDVAAGLAKRGVRVVRFEFPYMAERRTKGTRRGPDRAPVTLATFRELAVTERKRAKKRGTRWFVGGKSMGGRIASMIADEVASFGVVCLGYPFWPPGKPRDDARIAHLRSLATPALILQGTRDPFGGRGEIEHLGIKPEIHFLEDGDHDFKPRKASGRTHAMNVEEAITLAAAFMGRS